MDRLGRKLKGRIQTEKALEPEPELKQGPELEVKQELEPEPEPEREPEHQLQFGLKPNWKLDSVPKS